MEIDKIAAQGNVSTAKIEDLSKVEQSTEMTEKVGEDSAAKVEFSENAQIYVDALEQVKNADEVRSDRVAELKAKIAEGTYSVDAEQIAEKMIQEHLEQDLISGA